MNNSKKMTRRVLLYILGQIILAFAVAFSINSNLGISPNSSLPFVLSLVLNVKLSTCIIAVAAIQILLQAVFLRRDFKLKNCTQLIISIIFGYFVDFAKWLVGDFCFPTYAGQLLTLMISIFMIGIGISLYVDTSLMPTPAEGLTLAISKAFKIKFHNAKNIQDITMVSLAILLGYICMGSLVGIGEGTVLSALLIGRAVKLVQRWIKPMVDKACY